MFVFGGVRDKAIERGLDIAGHGGIVAFIHENSGGRVRHVEMAHAVGAAGLAHRSFDFGGDILQLGAPRGPHAKRVREGVRLLRGHESHDAIRGGKDQYS